MASKIEEVFVDTSWFKAFVDDKDDFYETAIEQYLSYIKPNKLHLITTNYILDETFTLIRVKRTLELAILFKKSLLGLEDVLKIIRVTEKDDVEAWSWFQNDWGKLSFTDCTSFAVMKRLELAKVATFDNHFQKAGFEMLSKQLSNEVTIN